MPLAIFLGYSFFRVEGNAIVHEPGIGNYARFFGEGVFLPVFARTCLLAAEVAAITLRDRLSSRDLAGFARGPPQARLHAGLRGPAADELHHQDLRDPRHPGRPGLAQPPPALVRADHAPIEALLFNLTAVLITLSMLLLPFTILPIFVALERIPRNLIEASADLGGTAWATFRRVVWPLSRQGAMIGASFTFVLAMGDFVTPQMVAG